MDGLAEVGPRPPSDVEGLGAGKLEYVGLFEGIEEPPIAVFGRALLG